MEYIVIMDIDYLSGLVESVPGILVCYSAMFYYCNSLRNEENAKIGILLILVLAVIFMYRFGEHDSMILNNSYGIYGAGMRILSFWLDSTKKVINFMNINGFTFEDKTLTRYQYTKEVWGCGSTSSEFQRHCIGAYSSFFFPSYAFDAINNCCSKHDEYYCCQIGQTLADKAFFSCVYDAIGKCDSARNDLQLAPIMIAMNDQLCEFGMFTYEFLLYWFGYIAYAEAPKALDCVDVSCM